MKKITIKIDKKTIWKNQKPLYNGFIFGYGVHGDTKYNRNKNKQDFRKEVRNYDY